MLLYLILSSSRRRRRRRSSLQSAVTCRTFGSPRIRYIAKASSSSSNLRMMELGGGCDSSFVSQLVSCRSAAAAADGTTPSFFNLKPINRTFRYGHCAAGCGGSPGKLLTCVSRRTSRSSASDIGCDERELDNNNSQKKKS